MSRVSWIPASAVMLLAAACGGTDAGSERLSAPADAAPEVSSASDAGPDAVIEGEAGPPDAPEDSPAEQQKEPPPEAGPDHIEEPPEAAAEAEAPDIIPGCGNGVRENDEECDDGLGDLVALRSCDSQCVVVDHLGEPDSEANERGLGTGRHPIAVGPSGYAIASIEWADPPRINVSTFDSKGQHSGFTHIEGVTEVAGPVLAPLPDGSFALAYAALGVDGDGLGIALVRIPAAGGDPGPVIPANEKVVFGQHSPDIIATPNGLAIAWQDNKPGYSPTVCHRRFNAQLAASGMATCLPFDSAARTNVVLADLDGSLVRAWTETGGIHVVVDGGADALLAFDGPGAPELAAVAGLDSQHLLVVYTDTAGAQRAAVLHHQQGLTPGGIVTLNAGGPERHTPTLGVTTDGVYLAWSEANGPDIDAGSGQTLQEHHLQKLTWDGTTLSGSSPALALPRRASHRLGDQHEPALAAHGDLLLAAWYDETNDNYAGECSHGDVAIELIPTPILRKQGIE